MPCTAGCWEVSLKLLFLTPQLPYPPQKGTTTRNFNLIKNLALRHEIHLLSFGDLANREHVRAMEEYCASIKLCAAPTRSLLSRVRDLLLSPNPDLAMRLASPQLTNLLRDILLHDRFDLLQVEGLEMTLPWRTVWMEERIRSAVKAVIFDEHNAEYVLQQRAFEIERGRPAKWIGAFYSFLQWRKLVQYEANICRGVDAVVTVSEADRGALQKIVPLLRTAIVPNGVDVDFFRSAGPGLRETEHVLLFSGTMDFRPNVDAVTWFCWEVLPLVRRQVPDVKLFIVGRDPLPVVVQLGRDPSIVVTGFVEDVRPFLRQASVYVVPMRFGGGIRFKVLEAMAAGIPVVSTTMGAEGVEVEPHQDLAIADDPIAFANSVVLLLRDDNRRAKMAEKARAIIERKYDWRTIVPKLEELYTEIL